VAVLLDVRFGAGGGAAGGARGPGRVTGREKEQAIGGQTWTGPGGATTGRGWIGLDGTDALGQQRREGCLSVCLSRGPGRGMDEGFRS